MNKFIKWLFGYETSNIKSQNNIFNHPYHLCFYYHHFQMVL